MSPGTPVNTTTTPTSAPSTFSFDWKAHRTNNVSITMLDDWFAAVLASSKEGLWGSIKAALLLIVGLAYLIARGKLVEEAERIARQDYDAAVHANHNNQVNI